MVIGLFSKYRVVVVTDRAILLLKASIWRPARPRELVARLPRGTPFNLSGKLWGKTEINGQRHYVHRRFFKDVAAADRNLPAAGASDTTGKGQAKPETVRIAGHEVSLVDAGDETTLVGWAGDDFFVIMGAPSREDAEAFANLYISTRPE